MIKVKHKHGVELPTLIVQTKKLDEKNVNNLSTNVTNQEMQNLKGFFEILEDGDKIPIGHNEASDHLVFDARVILELKDNQV